MIHSMMNTTGTGFGLTALWGIHVLSVLLFFVGVLFLILWAAKTLNHGQLKTWGIGLAIGGALLCLLTIGAKGSMWNGYGMGGLGNGYMMQNGGWDNDDVRGMMGNGGGISMNGMNMMLQGKTGDAFDKAFLEGMIPHHQGAVDMANATLRDAKHEELKQMARDIITSQQKEIDMMKQWQKEWGYVQ